MKKSLFYIIFTSVLSMSLMQSCFTGVESTKKITDKDVQQAIMELERGKGVATLEPFVDSLPSWREGKTFWVVDSQACIVFSPSVDYDVLALDLEGKQLTFKRFVTRRNIDNSEVVDIVLSDGEHELVYPTGKSLADVSHKNYAIPFLVDGDMVQSYSNQVVGKTVFVKTSTWQARGGDKIEGRKYVPVEITSVKPGNRVYPLRVEFKVCDTGEEAMLWMTVESSSLSGRDFDSLFSLTDVRKHYPGIAASVWDNIVNGVVVEGMTKEECRLSMGAPKRVSQIPDQTGLREFWYYDGGRYLFFVDGVLKEFR